MTLKKIAGFETTTEAQRTAAAVVERTQAAAHFAAESTAAPTAKKLMAHA